MTVDIHTKRKISHDEADEIVRRLINSHFHKEPYARVGIPARPDYDDDLLICAYIEQQRAISSPSAKTEIRNAALPIDMSAITWRCDITKNPVGTDTKMIGAPPCICQGCVAAAREEQLGGALLITVQERDALENIIRALQSPSAPADTAGGGQISLLEAFGRLQTRLEWFCNEANAGRMPSDGREFMRRVVLGFASAYEEAGVAPPDRSDAPVHPSPVQPATGSTPSPTLDPTALQAAEKAVDESWWWVGGYHLSDYNARKLARAAIIAYQGACNAKAE